MVCVTEGSNNNTKLTKGMCTLATEIIAWHHHSTDATQSSMVPSMWLQFAEETVLQS